MVERPDFPRRIPWLLADNGCEERAGAVAYYLHQWGYPTPHFARVKAMKGKSLVLQTENDPNGVVKWSGHVAGVVRVGRELMILDPAIEPTQPVRIAQWLARQTKSLDDIDVALCRDYPVGDSCFAATPVEPSPPETDAGGAMQSRLLTEWRVQEILGRDPLRTLGDCPPWASCLQPEPVADPSLPPVIGRFASNQFEDDVYVPFFIIGNNFVDGLTTVRIVGNQIDQLAMTESCMLRRILVVDDYPPGDYVVTAFNGQLASQSVPLTIH